MAPFEELGLTTSLILNYRKAPVNTAPPMILPFVTGIVDVDELVKPGIQTVNHSDGDKKEIGDSVLISQCEVAISCESCHTTLKESGLQLQSPNEDPDALSSYR
jgi:hypothetical protein